MQIRHWLTADPYDKAQDIYERTIELMGESHVRNVAENVLAAHGDIPVPPEVGDWQDTDKLHAPFQHLGSGDAKRFLLGQLAKPVGNLLPVRVRKWRIEKMIRRLKFKLPTTARG
jgi:hypothetical protein